MNMKVNPQPCIRGDFVENQDASQVQQNPPQTSPASEANATEQSEQISQSRKSEMDQSAKMKAVELQNTQKTNAPQGTKSEAAQKVDAEMEKSRANGGNMRDVVVAGAKADEGNIHVGYYGISKGEDRMREIYKDTAGIPLEKNQKYDRNGQPMLQMKEGKGPSSWCGVWGTDIWSRAGCDAKWGLGKPTDSKGKELPRVDIKSHQDSNLQNVKPGDMIVTNSFDTKTGNTKKGSTNHHALVTAVDYQVAGQSGKVTCPPAEVPKDGKAVGFHTMNGNSPGVPDAETKENPAIRKGYVDLNAKVMEEANGNKYEKRISNYYPMPPAKK
jgi:hypothetical protein